MNRSDVVLMLEKACREAGGVKPWSDRHGVTVTYVNYILSGRRNPGKTILEALGLGREIFYYQVKQLAKRKR